MIYKKLPLVGDQQQIYARIENDGKCYVTCTDENSDFQSWLAEGNTPEEASE